MAVIKFCCETKTSNKTPSSKYKKKLSENRLILETTTNIKANLDVTPKFHKFPLLNIYNFPCVGKLLGPPVYVGETIARYCSIGPRPVCLGPAALPSKYHLPPDSGLIDFYWSYSKRV